jgi:5'-phosphate synthase pdxT subunit
LEKVIGVFALQGDFHKHKIAVEKLGHKAVLVKDRAALERCDKLIIPGGESTTFLKLVDKLEMRAPLLEFAENHGIMGTCAGLIILASTVLNFELEPLGLIDIVVERNAYGRQIDSFVDTVVLNLGADKINFEGVFIRAPKIVSLGDGVRALGEHKGETIMAASGNILAATFHPELTDDLTVHRFFIDEF